MAFSVPGALGSQVFVLVAFLVYAYVLLRA